MPCVCRMLCISENCGPLMMHQYTHLVPRQRVQEPGGPRLPASQLELGTLPRVKASGDECTLSRGRHNIRAHCLATPAVCAQ